MALNDLKREPLMCALIVSEDRLDHYVHALHRETRLALDPSK